jgi:heat shock protein HtpX
MKTATSQNSRKGWTILILFVVFSATLGFLVGKVFDAGFTGAIVGLIFSLAYSIFALLFSDGIILATLAAKPILRENNLHLYERVKKLAEETGIPIPELFYVDDTAMNILSLGNSHKNGKVVLTRGLIDKLSAPEIESVVAHELFHIKTLDTQLGSLVTTVVGIFPFIAETLKRRSVLFLPLSLLFSLVSPLSGLLIHIVLSPKREFEADAAGILITRYPTGLIHALEKITQDPYSVRHATLATAHFFIVNPFHGKANRAVSGLYNTHPPLQERIKVLESM